MDWKSSFASRLRLARNELVAGDLIGRVPIVEPPALIVEGPSTCRGSKGVETPWIYEISDDPPHVGAYVVPGIPKFDRVWMEPTPTSCVPSSWG